MYSVACQHTVPIDRSLGRADRDLLQVQSNGRYFIILASLSVMPMITRALRIDTSDSFEVIHRCLGLD